MSTQMQAKEDELLAEFRSLIDQVGTAVARESVLPAVQQLINDWTAQTKKLGTQFEKGLNSLDAASRSIATTLETQGRQLRSDMADDTKKWQAAFGQQSAVFTQMLTDASRQVSELGGELEELSTQLAGAWETAATSLSDSCDKILSNTDLPSELAALSEYTKESQAVVGHVRQATNAAVGALERWQSEMGSVLQAVESRLPPLTKEVDSLHTSLQSWQLTADQVNKGSRETARALSECAGLTRKSVERIEAMAKGLDKQLLKVQEKVEALARDAQTMAEQAQKERGDREAALQGQIVELRRSLGGDIQRLEEQVRHSSDAALAAENEARSALQSLLQGHDQRSSEAQARTSRLIVEVQDELWRRTKPALWGLAALIMVVGGALGWLLLR